MHRYIFPLLLGAAIVGCQQSATTTPAASDQAGTEAVADAGNTRLISLKLPGMT